MFLDLAKLLFTLPIVLILPGFFLLFAIFGWKNPKLSFFERAVLTVPMSIIAVDFLVLFLGKIEIPIRGPYLVSAIAFFCLACYAAHQFCFRHSKAEKSSEGEKSSEDLFNFTFWQAIFILVSVFLAVFVRSSYFADTIVPGATDLGHHMYWSQTIVEQGRLPDYQMPDFIIGEHIVFSVMNLISGAKLTGAMPALVLFFASIAGIFALAILATRIFKDMRMTAVVIFAVGVLYAINAPQGKYVTGGVVGNVLGNLMIPIALYFLYRALLEKDSIFAGLFIFSAVGLLYTHHLSSFILIYSIAAIILFYLIANVDRLFAIVTSWIRIFLKPFPIVVLVFGLWFLVFVYAPTYFNSEAVGQATGAPTKITRVGLNLDQLEMNAGSARIILGSLGFLLLAAGMKRREPKYSFALAWGAVLLLMSAKPAWLWVNVPSNRIGNYLFLPFSLLAAFGLVEFLRAFRKYASGFFSAVLLFVLLFFVITDGLADSAEAFKARPQYEEVVQTFHSAQYLSRELDTSQDVLLKDHVNIYGDSWYKLFFMKDYKYPLSRGNLSRYIDPTKPRETCTRDMISEPQSSSGRNCFAETRVNYVALNAQLEGNSFEKYPEFSKVYASNYISVFRRD